MSMQLNYNYKFLKLDQLQLQSFLHFPAECDILSIKCEQPGKHVYFYSVTTRRYF